MMNKQKDKNQHSIRLAVAAATLGMSMGVAPGVVLASSDTAVSNKPLQVAATKVNPAKGNRQVKPTLDTKPGVAYPKIEKPGAQFDKYERPGTQYWKYERPGAQFPKVEQPGK